MLVLLCLSACPYLTPNLTPPSLTFACIGSGTKVKVERTGPTPPGTIHRVSGKGMMYFDDNTKVCYLDAIQPKRREEKRREEKRREEKRREEKRECARACANVCVCVHTCVYMRLCVVEWVKD